MLRMSEEQQIDPNAEPQPNCPKCGGEMWDNRASKRNPRAPDYKCKSSACDGVIWPPREAGAQAAVATPAGGPDDPSCPVCGGKMWDDRATKRNPRAPDFKCRNKPTYQGAPGCPGVIWPPRDGQPRAAAKPASAPTRGAAPATRASAPPPPSGFDRPFSDDELPDFDREDDLPF